MRRQSLRCSDVREFAASAGLHGPHQGQSQKANEGSDAEDLKQKEGSQRRLTRRGDG